MCVNNLITLLMVWWIISSMDDNDG